MAHVGARLGGHHKIEPSGIGPAVGRGDDLHGLAVLQRGAQRHQAPVDLGGHAGVAHVGMHRVGEVHGGGAARQAADVALGREHVDFVREQVHLHVLRNSSELPALCCISTTSFSHSRARTAWAVAPPSPVLYSQ